ncbi:MAG: hypothetical protein WB579_07740 [Bryobacteraceae bacterium]
MYSGQIELAGQDGNSRALYNQHNGIANFLPRLGLAYSLDDKTVVRAAFSRSSFEEGTGEFNRLATNAPWNVDLVGQWGGTGANSHQHFARCAQSAIRTEVPLLTGNDR